MSDLNHGLPSEVLSRVITVNTPEVGIIEYPEKGCAATLKSTSRKPIISQE